MGAYLRSAAFPRSSGSEPSLTDAGEVSMRPDSELLDLRAPLKRGELSEAAKRRQIWAIFLIGFMDLFSVSMVIPLFPRLIRIVGASPSVAGLIGSLYGALQIFSSPMVGKLSDVYGRKPLLLASYIVPAIGYLLTGFSGSLILLIVARIPSGIMKHGLSLSKAYLTDITVEKERRSILGMFNACSSLGFIFGPLISGYIADWDQTLRFSMISGAVLFVLNAGLVWLLVRPVSSPKEVANQDKAKGDLQDMLSSGQFLTSLNIFSDLGDWKGFGDMFFIRFLTTFSVIMFRSNLTIFLQEHFEIDYKTLGMVISFNSVVGVVAAATCGYISRLYSSHTSQMIHAVILLSFSVFGITTASSVVVVALCMVPLSVATANLRICSTSLLLSRAKEKKGTAIGLGNSISSGSRMLSPSFVGFAQEYSNELAGYVSSGLAVTAAVVMTIYPLDKPHRLEPQADSGQSSDPVEHC